MQDHGWKFRARVGLDKLLRGEVADRRRENHRREGAEWNSKKKKEGEMGCALRKEHEG